MRASQVLSDPLQRALYDATRPMSRATREVRRCSPVAAVHCHVTTRTVASRASDIHTCGKSESNLRRNRVAVHSVTCATRRARRRPPTRHVLRRRRQRGPHARPRRQLPHIGARTAAAMPAGLCSGALWW